MSSPAPLFKNSYVTLEADAIRIHTYYFPFANAKVIPYNQIKSVSIHTMLEMGFTGSKTWGMGLSEYWWPCDWLRVGRAFFISIDTGSWPKIAVTMDDDEIQRCYETLSKMVNGATRPDSAPKSEPPEKAAESNDVEK